MLENVIFKAGGWRKGTQRGNYLSLYETGHVADACVEGINHCVCRTCCCCCCCCCHVISMFPTSARISKCQLLCTGRQRPAVSAWMHTFRRQAWNYFVTHYKGADRPTVPVTCEGGLNRRQERKFREPLFYFQTAQILTWISWSSEGWRSQLVTLLP